MTRRVTVVLGHPDTDSLCGALAETYLAAAVAAGHETRAIRLGEIDFDPVLRHGYRIPQPLEPGLAAAQEAVLWCDHLVLVYPVWWGAMPALMKGFIDRAFLPGVAFRYRQDSPWWDRLLRGRSADVITTMDTPAWYFRWVYRNPAHHQVRRTILRFCGFRRLRFATFAPVRSASVARRARWLARVAALAAGLPAAAPPGARGAHG